MGMGMGDMETAFQSALDFNQNQHQHQRPAGPVSTSSSSSSAMRNVAQANSAWMGDFERFGAGQDQQGKGKGREVESFQPYQPGYQNQNHAMGMGYYPPSSGMGMGMGMMGNAPSMGMSMCMGGSYGQQTIQQPAMQQHVQGMGPDLFDEKDLERAFEEVEMEARAEENKVQDEVVDKEQVEGKGKGGDFEA